MAVETTRAARTTDDPAGPTTTQPGASTRPARLLRLAFGVAAAVLVALAWRLPVWEARLSAPQYPNGLQLTASATGVTGDISEVNELNHYVGMQAFSDAAAPEMKLWGPVILIGLFAVAVGALPLRRSVPGRLARLGLWTIPIGALADVQFRLYQYGHSVQPNAAIRLDPFTPLVVGPTRVLNFTTWAYPGAALGCLFAGAFLLSFGPGLVRRGRTWWATRPIYVDPEVWDEEGEST